MPRPFSELSKEFNATAKSYIRDDVSVELLTTKYSVLMSHKAKEPEEKRELVTAMYECGLKWLAARAEAGATVDHQTTVSMTSLFSRLTEDDSINFIPPAAPEQLTDVALDLLRRAEGPAGGGGSSKGYIVKLAGQTLAAADKIKAAHLATTDVTTSQDITPSKTITLKQKDEFKL
ncbi:MAG: hypothetical protein EPN97_18545 [Alphaproteobacteria bacterium]|nr:MAG: hypothetical protein EPN97_18545 [Alphaproteobacteria bacterium]